MVRSSTTKDLPNTHRRSTAETAMNPIGQTFPVIHIHLVGNFEQHPFCLSVPLSFILCPARRPHNKSRVWQGRRMMIAAVTTLLAAVLGCYLWWRFSELARARGQKRKLHGRKILPSPCRLLPKWLGFLGGHTLLIDGEQVGRLCVERVEWLN